MNDILFGNNNMAVIKRLSKRYFKKNKVRNIAAILAISEYRRNFSHFSDGFPVYLYYIPCV